MIHLKYSHLLSICFVLFMAACNPGKNQDAALKAGMAEDKIPERSTLVTIEGEKFLINGKPALEGVEWNGISMEGMLPNSRMVQGIFDDLNPETVEKWKYPDTGEWDPDRNTREFVAAMDEWRRYGLLAFTLNLQGGSPEGYSAHQPWINTSFTLEGSLRDEYMNRLKLILDRSDELGMVTILGLFYFGQDEHLEDDEAVRNAVRNAIGWVLDQGYSNVIIEVANECDNRAYNRSIIKKDSIPELISLAKSIERDGKRLLVATSFNGNTVPTDEVVKVSDFVLIHGNGVNDPARITEMVNETRALPSFRPMPVVFNEDDHYDFDQPENNMLAAFRSGASWGFFDFRREGESFEEGYQSVPVDWGITSDRKKTFFEKIREITGGGK
jgi:hypothetical protein